MLHIMSLGTLIIQSELIPLQQLLVRKSQMILVFNSVLMSIQILILFI